MRSTASAWSGCRPPRAAQRRAQRVGDALDRFGLVGMQAARRRAAPRDAGAVVRRTRPILEHAHRPTLLGGLAGEAAARGVVGAQQQGAAMALAEPALLEQ